MAPRQLPGVGLQGFETPGTAGWNGFVDANWRVISAWLQARVKSVVANVPGSGMVDGDMHIVTGASNTNALAIRDNGVWVYLTAQNGHRVYDEETQLNFVFNGTAWAPEFADLTATNNGAALNLRKRGSSVSATAPTAANGSIGLLQFTGWTGVAWKLGAQIIGQAQQLWSGAANGTGIVFQVIAINTTTLIDKMRLTATTLWVDVPIIGVAAQRMSVFATYGGTANAITLSYGHLAHSVGMQVRFRATATNTGATTINLDGIGATACRTVTGVALPAGYIRTGVETVATYDGAYWVLERETERGGNANGEWVRYADGTQYCQHSGFASTSEEAVGSIFRSVAEASWTFPVSFVDSAVSVVGAAFNPARWLNARATAATTALIRQYSALSSSVSVSVSVQATGRWY